MKIFKEFKDFAMKGNVVDLAVGVVIGGAFGKITTSLVNDIILPAIGAIFGSPDFSNLYYAFGNPEITTGMTLAEAQKVGGVLAYGNFITVLLNFLIIAFAIFFFVVKPMNAMKRKEEPKKEEPKGPSQEELLGEIRDLLKK